MSETDNRTVGRGGGWVAAQMALLAVVAALAAFGPEWPAGQLPRTVGGGALGLAGIVVGVMSARSLGAALTPFPRPRPGAPLARSGPYRLVRHPMYLAVLCVAFGVAIVGSPWALLPAGVLAVVLDRKAQHEERWLAAIHADYARWSTTVRWRIVPGVR